MFKKIPGNHDFIISLNGAIRKSNGSISELSITANKVTIILYGVLETLDIFWLALIAHFEVDLPYLFKSISFVDCNPVLIRSNSGIFMKFHKPILIKDEFRIIPNYTTYAISKEGKVIDIEQNNEMCRLDNKAAYPVVHIYDPDKGHYKYVMIHRLVALAWVNNSDFVYRPIVNHKDGKKDNFHYSNLEWCTYTENIEHAIASGLTNKTKRYKVKDITTSIIKEYDSFKLFCLDVDLDPNTKFKYKNYKTKIKLIKDRFEIKEIDDNSPWLTDDPSFVKKNKYTITVIYTDGFREIFYNIVDIMRRLKIWNISYNIAEIIKAAEIKYPGIKFEVVENISTLPLQAYNVKTGEVIEAESIRKMSLLTNFGFSTIHNAVNASKAYICKGFVFRFKTDLPWDMDFQKLPNATRNIRAINIENGEVIDFQSMRAIEAALNTTRNVVLNRIANNSPLGKWKLKEI